MYSVILCGGSGNRLWPLSRNNFPKQFLKLYSDKSLLQETFLRMQKIMDTQNIYFVTNKNNFFNVFNQIKEIENNFDIKQILTEPMSLNTAPAISYAVKYLAEKRSVDLSAPIIVLPSDHYIEDIGNYLALVTGAMKTIGNKIGTIGISPQGAETGFGYIKKGKKIDNYFQVIGFKEKPNKDIASEYLASGEYVWNSGMYIFSIQTFAREVRQNAPEIYKLLEQSFDNFIDNFSQLPAISFDYAISEKSQNVVVWEGDFEWSDIGSFDSLAEKMKNKINNKQINIDSQNIYVHSSNNKLVVTLGVDDLVVVENNDSILIQKRGRGEDVSKIVDYLKKNKIKELNHNLIVHRPWGRFDVLIDNPTYKVKKIIIYPGEKLSLQAHYHRAEHWVVVKGTAKVINGDENIILRENESTFIPVYSKHKLENIGKINLEIIEVQTGNYLGEDDIIRFIDIDNYNRLNNK